MTTTSFRASRLGVKGVVLGRSLMKSQEIVALSTNCGPSSSYLIMLTPSHAHLRNLCPPDPSRFGVCLICLRMTQLPQLRLDSHGWPTLATGNPLQGPHHLNTESGWKWNVDHVDHLNHVDIYRIEKSWRFFAPILHCQREGLRCLNWLIDCWSVPSFRFTIPKLTLHPPFFSQARTEY